MSCCIYQRVIDDRSGRTVEQLVAVVAEDQSPAVALSTYFDEEDPLPGTYVAECRIGERLHTVALTYEPRTATR